MACFAVERVLIKQQKTVRLRFSSSDSVSLAYGPVYARLAALATLRNSEALHVLFVLHRFEHALFTQWTRNNCYHVASTHGEYCKVDRSQGKACCLYLAVEQQR